MRLSVTVISQRSVKLGKCLSDYHKKQSQVKVKGHRPRSRPMSEKEVNNKGHQGQNQRSGIKVKLKGK